MHNIKIELQFSMEFDVQIDFQCWYELVCLFAAYNFIKTKTPLTVHCEFISLQLNNEQAQWLPATFHWIFIIKVGKWHVQFTLMSIELNSDILTHRQPVNNTWNSNSGSMMDKIFIGLVFFLLFFGIDECKQNY